MVKMIFNVLRMTMTVFRLFGLSCFLFVGLLGSVVQAEVCGILTNAQGQVEVLRIDSKNYSKEEEVRIAIIARQMMKLQCSDIVVTYKASRAKVKVRGGGHLSLGSNSRIALAGYEKGDEAGLLDLTYGRVRALFRDKARKKMKGESKEEEESTDRDGTKDKSPEGSTQQGDQVRFRIKTPSAVVGVRGTDFYVGYEPNSGVMDQATLSGAVEVKQNGSDQVVLVEKGKQVSVENLALLSDSESPSAPVKAKVKPLEIRSIQPQVIAKIQDASLIAKDDKEFLTPEATAVLGEPEKWTPLKEEIPEQFRHLRNEF